MPVLAEIVETKELVETVVYAFVAGVGVTVIFSVAIWGVARFVDLSQEERPLAAGAAVGVTALALLAVAAVVVIGIVVMTSK
jgi:Na+-translocating ferredoxin:NAD+ oxidoreductase RnfA subunit